MYSIKIKTSPGLEKLFARYPQLYEQAREKGTNKSLDLLQKTAHEKAPYLTGTLRREIKQLYSQRMLVAGTHQSRPYAYVQETGMTIKARNRPYIVFQTKDGSWHSVKQVTIKPKKYFFGAMKEKSKEVLDIFAKEFRRVLGG